jgi:hypothetical protein
MFGLSIHHSYQLSTTIMNIATTTNTSLCHHHYSHPSFSLSLFASSFYALANVYGRRSSSSSSTSMLISSETFRATAGASRKNEPGRSPLFSRLSDEFSKLYTIPIRECGRALLSCDLSLLVDLYELVDTSPHEKVEAVLLLRFQYVMVLSTRSRYKLWIIYQAVYRGG